MKNHYTPACDRCGKRFKGKRINGHPTMVTFYAGGKYLHLCHECVMEVGKAEKDKQKEFINEVLERIEKVKDDEEL